MACCDCTNQPSWVLWTCEDGNCVPIPPPSVFAVLVYDPNKSPQTGPYYEKPANFPVAELRDMLTNMISSMTPTQVMNLWAQLINGMTNTEKSGLAAALVGKLQCAPPPPATGSCTMTSI